jgi:hypothetical protein
MQGKDRPRTMRTLTSNYQDCELLNLGSNKNGRGPYVLRQDGVPPDSLRAQEDRFLLSKDGTWDLTVTAFTLPEKEQEQQFIFQDAAELYSAVENLLKGPLCRTPYLLGKVVRNFSQLLSRLRFLRFGAECAKRAQGLMKLGI